MALPLYYAITDLTQDGNLTRIGENLVDGLSNGSIWALVAIGYTLVYGIIELINFAHGEVFMIGSFVSVALFATLGLTSATGVGGLILGLLAHAHRRDDRLRDAERADRAGRRTDHCAQRRSSRR